MSDNSVEPRRASITLPATEVGSNITTTANIAKASACMWTTRQGHQVVTVGLGDAQVTVTPEQWRAINETVETVLPQAVTA